MNILISLKGVLILQDWICGLLFLVTIIVCFCICQLGRIVVFNPDFVDYDTTVPYRAFAASTAEKYGAVAVLVRSISPYGLQVPLVNSPIIFYFFLKDIADKTICHLMLTSYVLDTDGSRWSNE